MKVILAKLGKNFDEYYPIYLVAPVAFLMAVFIIAESIINTH